MTPDNKHTLETRDMLMINPVYIQDSPNDIIDLTSFQARITDENTGKTQNACGKAQLRFAPRLGVDLFFPAESNDLIEQYSLSDFFFPGRNEHKIHFKEYETTIDAFLISISPEGLLYSPKIRPIQVFPDTDSISTAVFHLLNWPSFNGPEDYILETRESQKKQSCRCGRFLLNVDGWEITVAATGRTTSLIKSLREKGGFVITHVGRIERIDERPFSTSDLDKILTMLSNYFSFVFGRWSSPSLAVGFDTAGNRVYEEWGTRRCDSGPWTSSQSWFDERHSVLFTDTFPGFYRLWNNDIWHRPLWEAVYWYVAANHGAGEVGIDSALLFSQAALELLSWTYCVQDRKMVSEKAFRRGGLSAADKLRILVSSLEIPLEIPDYTISLHSKVGSKWEDSMHAITDLRNSLVHPDHAKTIPKGAYYDAWRLSLWYLDLVLLRLCSYNGHYANRLSQRYVGEIEPVPWNS